MKEQRKTLKLRFPGFTDDWEQRKISELCLISTGKSNTQDKVEDGKYPFYVRSPIIERSAKYLYDEEAVITVGDGVGTGKVFHYVNGKYDLHQRCYRMYSFSNELNAHYFYHIFSKLFYRRVMTMTAKTSVDSVRLEMISDMKIPIPNVDEQRKIGKLLDSIDNLITLHQRKCDAIKELKKGMLQKMFPKNGEKIPEVRFPGFTDDWEQRKLGEIITEYKETVDSDCTLPILTSSKTEGVILQEEHFGRKQQHDITGYNILPRNYCTYRNRSDGVDFTFNINKCCDKGIISKFYPVFSGKNSDVLFLSLVLNHSDEVVREIAYTCTGTGQKVLSFLDLQKMKVRVPGFDEQKEIAAYFDSLDHLITLHQRKVEKLKEMKKGLLQQMFV